MNTLEKVLSAQGIETTVISGEIAQTKREKALNELDDVEVTVTSNMPPNWLRMVNDDELKMLLFFFIFLIIICINLIASIIF